MNDILIDGKSTILTVWSFIFDRPFERKTRDNEILFKHLQYFPELADQVPSHVLKELCSVAQLDRCPEEDYTG